MAAETIIPDAIGAPNAPRGARRFDHEADCEVVVEALGPAVFACSNLSARGVFFRASVCLDEGTRLRCAIPLPDRAVWVAEGEVVRVALSEGTPEPGIAVAFDEVSELDRRRLLAAFR